MNVDLAGSTENPIQLALSGEQAGLDILAADGIGPKQDIHKLIQDVTKELRILDFTAGVMTPAATVAKLQIEQRCQPMCMTRPHSWR